MKYNIRNKCYEDKEGWGSACEGSQEVLSGEVHVSKGEGGWRVATSGTSTVARLNGKAKPRRLSRDVLGLFREQKESQCGWQAVVAGRRVRGRVEA